MDSNSEQVVNNPDELITRTPEEQEAIQASFECWVKIGELESDLQKIEAIPVTNYSQHVQRKNDIAKHKTEIEQLTNQALGKTVATGRPPSKKITEIDAILASLGRLEFDAKNLPVGTGLQAGAKNAVWMDAREIFTSRSAFDSRWKQMKQDGFIGDAKSI